MTDKNTYIQKQEAQLEEWQAKIDVLKAKAKQAQADTKMDLEHSIKQIEAAREAASNKIAEMRRSDDSTWQRVKSDVESAVDNLKQAMSRLTSK